MAKKLKRDDPGFFAAIGKLGGKARKESGVDYSALAASSHPRKDGYHGGRPKKPAVMGPSKIVVPKPKKK